MTDDDRRLARARWASSAPGWHRHAERQRQMTMPVSIWMVEAIRPQPGHTIVELAAGTGETGFLAAELIQPGGTLICSDLVPEMLAAAQERAEALGIRNVRFRQIDAETAIDQPAASVDGVLCRWGYMLMADPGTALRETRRILRPGGRVALAAWAAPQDNMWSRLPAATAIRRGLAERPDPNAPGQFAWAPEGRCAAALEETGFGDVEVDDVTFTLEYASFDEWWQVTLDMSFSFREILAPLDAAARDGLREEVREGAEPFRRGDGGYAFPARTWVAAATA
jgi:SAM-dependent methyltransferase